MLKRILSRILLISLALFLSLITAGIVVCFICVGMITTFFDNTKISSVGFIDSWKVFEVGFSSNPNLIFVLLLAIIFIGEIFRLRFLLYYILGFGLPIGLFTLYVPHIESEMYHNLNQYFWQMFMTAGFAAGFIYWLVAGRSD